MQEGGLGAVSFEIPEVAFWLLLAAAILLLGWSVWKVLKILGL